MKKPDLKDVSIGSRIKSARALKGIPQWQISEHTGLKTPAISKVENGSRSLAAKEIPDFAEGLGVSTGFILGLETDVIYKEEREIILAMREIPFEDFQAILKQLESLLFFASQKWSKKKKTHLRKTSEALQSLAERDSRPRGIQDS